MEGILEDISSYFFLWLRIHFMMMLEKTKSSNFLNMNSCITGVHNCTRTPIPITQSCQTAPAPADYLFYEGCCHLFWIAKRPLFQRAWRPGLHHILSTFFGLSAIHTAHTEIGFFIGVRKKEGSIRQDSRVVTREMGTVNKPKHIFKDKRKEGPMLKMFPSK